MHSDSRGRFYFYFYFYINFYSIPSASPAEVMSTLPTRHMIASSILLNTDPTAQARTRLRASLQMLHRGSQPGLLPLFTLTLRLERRTRDAFMPTHAVHEAQLRRTHPARHDGRGRAPRVELPRFTPGAQTPPEIRHVRDAREEHVVIVAREHRGGHEHG